MLVRLYASFRAPSAPEILQKPPLPIHTAAGMALLALLLFLVAVVFVVVFVAKFNAAAVVAPAIAAVAAVYCWLAVACSPAPRRCRGRTACPCVSWVPASPLSPCSAAPCTRQGQGEAEQAKITAGQLSMMDILVVAIWYLL